MAEYIEREALLNALKEERKNGNFVFTSKWIKEIMDNLPTADVVPKSEVDWNSIPVDVSEALKQRAVEKAKSDVAREIFEDIEKKIVAEIDYYNTALIEFEDSSELYHRIRGEVFALCAIQNFIAELKKKYTEQCPDCKHFVGCEKAVWSGRCEDFDYVRKEDELYEKGYNDALKDVEEMILERKNENTPKI